MTNVELAPSEAHLARVSLGIIMRNLRARRGLTQAAFGKLIALSQPEVSKLERAAPDAKSLDPKLFASIMRTLAVEVEERDTLAHYYELLKVPEDSYRVIFAANAVEKQKKILAYEKQSKEVRQFEHVLVPGLLQVPDYMRAVIGAYGVARNEIEGVVAQRELRQRILSDPLRAFNFILTESVLYTAPAGPAVQVEQLRTLLERMARRTVSIGVIRVVDGAVPLAATAFTLYDQKFAAVETIVSEQQITEVADLRTLRRLHESLAARAQYGAAAASIIRAAISQFEADGHGFGD